MLKVSMLSSSSSKDQYTKRKFWGFYVDAGTTDGHEQAADITNAPAAGDP